MPNPAHISRCCRYEVVEAAKRDLVLAKGSSDGEVQLSTLPIRGFLDYVQVECEMLGFSSITSPSVVVLRCFFNAWESLGKPGERITN